MPRSTRWQRTGPQWTSRPWSDPCALATTVDCDSVSRQPGIASFTHRPFPSQRSRVHGLASLHGSWSATQAPLAHVPPCRHFVASSHTAPSDSAGASRHAPVVGSQTSAAWHASGGGQTTGFSATHAPRRHVDVAVHAFRSSHGVPSGIPRQLASPARMRRAPAIVEPSEQRCSKSAAKASARPRSPSFRYGVTSYTTNRPTGSPHRCVSVSTESTARPGACWYVSGDTFS